MKDSFEKKSAKQSFLSERRRDDEREPKQRQKASSLVCVEHAFGNNRAANQSGDAIGQDYHGENPEAPKQKLFRSNHSQSKVFGCFGTNATPGEQPYHADD